ncbi:hypothetical protein VPHD148_0192 [Vibrio phage D148]
MLGAAALPVLLSIAMVLNLIGQIYLGDSTPWYEWVIYIGYPAFTVKHYFGDMIYERINNFRN